jgi:WhiB family redox-sensing transcriptional regulator
MDYVISSDDTGAHVEHGHFGKNTIGIKAPYFDGSQLCAETDPELFFPEKGSPGSLVKSAKNICNLCEFKAPCLEYALQESSADIWGIWGGTTYEERKKIRRLKRVS